MDLEQTAIARIREAARMSEKLYHKFLWHTAWYRRRLEVLVQHHVARSVRLLAPFLLLFRQKNNAEKG